MADSVTYNKQCLKGKWKPKNPKKYIGNVANIVYRSSLELMFFQWADLNGSVLTWSSEEVVIPYKSVDGMMHRYFVDAFVKIRTKSGEVKNYLVEIKPSRFTQEPKIPKKKTQAFLQECIQWQVNQKKWEAARGYAAKIGAAFILITEEDIGLLTIPFEPFKKTRS